MAVAVTVTVAVAVDVAVAMAVGETVAVAVAVTIAVVVTVIVACETHPGMGWLHGYPEVTGRSGYKGVTPTNAALLISLHC